MEQDKDVCLVCGYPILEDSELYWRGEVYKDLCSSVECRQEYIAILLAEEE